MIPLGPKPFEPITPAPVRPRQTVGSRSHTVPALRAPTQKCGTSAAAVVPRNTLCSRSLFVETRTAAASIATIGMFSVNCADGR
jgi:hypothetical protein